MINDNENFKRDYFVYDIAIGLNESLNVSPLKLNKCKKNVSKSIVRAHNTQITSH